MICGIGEVDVITDSLAYTYIVGDPEFDLSPITFVDSPKCGYFSSVFPNQENMPGFITATIELMSQSINFHMDQIDDNELAGLYTLEINFSAFQPLPLVPILEQAFVEITVLKNCAA